MADLANESDIDAHLDASKGSGGKYPVFKFEPGTNYFLLLSTNFSGGHHHWAKTTADYPTPIPSVNQAKGYSPEEDAFDAWCEKTFKQARKLEKEGDKESAKKLLEKAKKVRSTYSARFVALKGKVVIRENAKGDEEEVVIFKSKSYTAEPGILILSQARTNSLLHSIKSEWPESDKGAAADFHKAKDVTKFIICATQDPKTKKITWSLFDKVNMEKLPEIDESLLKDMIADCAEQYKPLSRDEFKAQYQAFIDNGASSDDEDEDDDLGDEDEDDGKKKTDRKKGRTKDDDDDDDI
jgi:hypothetical protein